MSSRSEYDQSSVARSVRMRPSLVGDVLVNNRKRPSRLAAISVGVMTATRAAASSIASAMPSRRRQISSTAAVFAGPIVNDGFTDLARSANSVTASVWPCEPSSEATGTDSEPRGQICSPAVPRRSRLVARIRRRGHESSNNSANRRAPSTTCSQLSRTSRICVSRSRSTTDCSTVRPGRVRTPIEAATTSASSPAEAAVASAQNHVPSG